MSQKLPLRSYSAKKMKLKIATVFLFYLFCLGKCDKKENCFESEPEKIPKCEWIDENSPSIFVKGTAGRLGNAIFSYQVLLGMKVRFENAIKIVEILQFFGIFDQIEA